MGEATEHEPEKRKERTALASDRTMLASERTLGAWWRTVIAALAAAIAVAEIHDDVRPLWIIRATASLPILLALLILFVAARRYTATARRIESEFVERVPRAELWIGTALLFLLCVAAALVVWVLGEG